MIVPGDIFSKIQDQIVDGERRIYFDHAHVSKVDTGKGLVFFTRTSDLNTDRTKQSMPLGRFISEWT